VWRLLLLVNLVLLPILAVAQSADDYFHNGAQYYIFGEKEKAQKQIVTGLQLYPADPKLSAVAQLLKKKDEQKQQNKQGKNEQQKKDQQSQQQESQQQQSAQQDKDKEGQKSEQQKKDEEKARQEQAKKDEEKREQQAKENAGDQDKTNGEQSAVAQAQMMTAQEARQLLDDQKDDEKVLIFAPSNQPISTLAGKIKDW
jgi:hypothetical protein